MNSNLRVYLFNLTEILNLRLFDSYQCLLDQDKLNKISSEKRKREYTNSRVLLSYILKNEYGVQSLPDLSYSENGKPFFKDHLIKFNISHSNDCIAVAVSEGKSLGVDIETLKKNNSYKKIAENYFSKDENSFLFSNEHMIKENFIKLWSLKESVFKLLDLSFSAQNLKIYFNLVSNNIIQLPDSFFRQEVEASYFKYNLNYVSLSTKVLDSKFKIMEGKLNTSNQETNLLSFQDITCNLKLNKLKTVNHS